MRTSAYFHSARTRWSRWVVGMVAATLVFVGAGAVQRAQAIGADEAAAAVELEFEKAAVADTVWVGTVSGDFDGVLTTVLIAADDSEPVWSVDFYWIVTADDPTRSFVARLAGTLDSETGEVAMRGSVVEGYRAGAAVDERGQLFDAERSAFRGSIRIQ